MEDNQMVATKLEIVMAKKEAGKLLYTAPAGHVLVWPNTPYHLVKLWMFGGQSFFLSVSKTNPKKYTLFAKKQMNPDGSTRLQNPVGHGVIEDDLPEYIELRLKLLGKTVFVSLIPANSNFNEMEDAQAS